MFSKLVTLAALLGVSAYAATPMTEEEYAFINWIAENRRFYGTKEEYEYRFQHFKKIYDEVKNHDHVATGYHKELNKFSDYSPEEY